MLTFILPFLKVMVYCLSLHSHQCCAINEWKYEKHKVYHLESIAPQVFYLSVLMGNTSSLNISSMTFCALTLANPSKISLPSQTDQVLRPITSFPKYLILSLPFSLLRSFAVIVSLSGSLCPPVREGLVFHCCASLSLKHIISAQLVFKWLKSPNPWFKAQLNTEDFC